MIVNEESYDWIKKKKINNDCKYILESLLDKLKDFSEQIFFLETRISFKKGRNSVVIIFPQKNSLIIHLQTSFYENLLEYNQLKSIFKEKPNNQNPRFIQVTVDSKKPLKPLYIELIKKGL